MFSSTMKLRRFDVCKGDADGLTAMLELFPWSFTDHSIGRQERIGHSDSHPSDGSHSLRRAGAVRPFRTVGPVLRGVRSSSDGAQRTKRSASAQ